MIPVRLDGSYSAFLTTACRVVKESLLKGFTPKVCPICRNPVDRLVLHHWTSDGGVGGKVRDILAGDYRRMCDACNHYLGSVYGGWGYPGWEEQFAKLKVRFSGLKEFYPNFDGVEGWWSRLTIREWKRIEEILFIRNLSGIQGKLLTEGW